MMMIAMTGLLFTVFRYLIFTDIHRFGVIKKYDLLLAATLVVIFYVFSSHMVSLIWKGRKESSLCHILFVMACGLVLLLPMTRINSGTVSQRENRKLAAAPTILVNNHFNYDYGKQYDLWMSDHFRGREKVLDVHDNLEFFLSQKVENSQAFEGKEDWLFYKGNNSIANYQNLNNFTDEELKTIKEKLEEKKVLCDAMGAHYYVLICPDKNKVYGEFYPSKYRKVNEIGRGEQLYRYLKEHSDVSVVYPLGALLAGKDQCDLYFRNDTHWNSVGAFIGYQELMKVIREEYPDLQPLRSDDFTRKEVKTGGDLQKMLNLSDREYKTTALEYKNKPTYTVEKMEPSKANIQANKGSDYLIANNQEAFYRVFVVRDSFSTALVPFLSQQFGHVEYAWTRQFFKNYSSIREKKPDIVIDEVVERLSQGLVN